MSWIKSYAFYHILIGGSLVISRAAVQKSGEIRDTQPATIPFDWDNLLASSCAFTDTLS